MSKQIEKPEKQTSISDEELEEVEGGMKVFREGDPFTRKGGVAGTAGSHDVAHPRDKSKRRAQTDLARFPTDQY